jgi:hypothetical protein
MSWHIRDYNKDFLGIGRDVPCLQLSIPAGTFSFQPENGSNDNVMYLQVTDSGIFVTGCKGVGYLDDQQTVVEAFFSTRAPFYGSIGPIIYTLAGATALAWLLLILLIISTKRRPWLQKFSAFALAAFLTGILVDATLALNEQYVQGYHDAFDLKKSIVFGLEFQIPAVIVQSIIWLAHLQILLRLFKRRKEIVIIKLVGSTLWCLDLAFWLTSVLTNRQQQQTEEMIPGPWMILAFSFEIMLVAAYALCVFIFTVRKRRFAYNRRTMVIAVISAAALTSPLVFLSFFVTTWISGWAVYITLVLNGAGNVIVWDWLDIIEALEKQEQKSGVMGRQIYEDEMAYEFDVNRRPSDKKSGASKTVRAYDKVYGKISHFDSYFSWPSIEWRSIFRVGTGVSGSTNYEANEDEDGIRLQNLSLRSEQPPPSSTGVEDFSKSSTRPGMDRFVHPIRASSRRQWESTSGSVGDLTNLQVEPPEEEDSDDDLYVINEPANAIPPPHMSMAEMDAAAISDEFPPEGPPPDVFDRVPDFDPGDYWDDKADPPGASGPSQ